MTEAASLEEAVEMAYLLAEKDWVILAFGSLSYLGALGRIIKDRKIQSKNEFLETILAHSQYKELYKSSIEFKTSTLFLETLDRFLHDIPELWIAFDDVYYEGACIVSKRALKDKILGRKETPLGIKLEQLEDSILELLFGAGKGRGQKAEKDFPIFFCFCFSFQSFPPGHPGKTFYRPTGNTRTVFPP